MSKQRLQEDVIKKLGLGGFVSAVIQKYSYNSFETTVNSRTV